YYITLRILPPFPPRGSSDLVLGGSGREVVPAVRKEFECGTDRAGLDRGHVSLEVDDDAGAFFRVDGVRRLVDPVRARFVVRPGHDGAAAASDDRRDDLRAVGRDRDRTD